MNAEERAKAAVDVWWDWPPEKPVDVGLESLRRCVADAIRAAETAAEARGAAREREECAKEADRWNGRRLEGQYDSEKITIAFHRGVNMAAYYIAEAIRARGSGAVAAEGGKP